MPEEDPVEFFKRISTRAEKVEGIIEEIRDFRKLVEDNSYFIDTALEYATDDLLDYMYPYVDGVVMNACVESGEFNYPPFIERLLNAIHNKRDYLFTLHSEGKTTKTVRVSSNFFVLGTSAEWGAAVRAARRELGLGATRGKKKTITNKDTGEEEDVDLALHIWREKIYGVAREGKTVSKTFKGRGKDKKSETRDVTDRYVGKYERTIEARLSFLGENQAPFWYIIEHGNANLRMGGAEGVDGYPTVPPTRFVNTITEHLTSTYQSLVNSYVGKVYDAIMENYNQYFKVDWDKIEDAEGWMDIERPEGELPEGGKELSTRWKQVAADTKAWNSQTKQGTVIRVRYKGQFTAGGTRIIK